MPGIQPEAPVEDLGILERPFLVVDACSAKKKTLKKSCIFSHKVSAQSCHFTLFTSMTYKRDKCSSSSSSSSSSSRDSSCSRMGTVVCVL